MPDPTLTYRGRFAPSPTGPLHLGSLIAALASYLDARHHGGTWLVRMEDLDPPREVPGAARAILHSLERHGLNTDEPVLYQSSRNPTYHDALEQLRRAGHIFACDCTRAMTGADGSCNGHCRQRSASIGSPHALRMNVPPMHSTAFDDRIQGRQRECVGQQPSDFVVKRKDGLIAYQLAVVVDDTSQAISHVVRGSDLLDTTMRQLFVYECLQQSPPIYGHLPVITTGAGQKFSKQNLAPPLNDDQALANLRLALRFLGQSPPPAELDEVAAFLDHAARNWSISRIPATLAIAAATLGLAL